MKETNSRPSIRYLKSLIKLLESSDIKELAIGDIKITRDKVEQPSTTADVRSLPLEQNSKVDSKVSADVLLSPPTTPEELELQINNLGASIAYE